MATKFNGRMEDTPQAWQGDTPMSVVSTSTTSTRSLAKPIETNMSLSAFQARYTSEDNESFYKLLDKKNDKRAERYAWMWAGNKIPAARQVAYREREAKLLTQGTPKEDFLTIEQSDTRKAMPDTWKYAPDNSLMFEPSSVEDAHQTVQQTAEEKSRAPPRAVVYDNTRLSAPSEPSAPDPAVPPSPSLSAVQDAISGRPRYTSSDASFAGPATPRINGYSFVDSEEPSPPLRQPSTSPSNDSSSLLLGKGDATPNPFNIARRSKREDLHHRMVDKVAKSKRQKAIEMETKTPVPKFASSPRVAKGGLTPAAQRLLGKVGGGGKTPSVWEAGKTPRRSGLRDVMTPVVGERKNGG